jgi:cytosine deaminase
MTSDMTPPRRVDRRGHHRPRGAFIYKIASLAALPVQATGGRGERRTEVSGTEASSEDDRWLALALEQARLGRAEGGIPIGAVLVADGRVLGAGRNRRVQLGSAIRHGETDAIENAGRLPAATYRRATMVTTLSPCFMCAGTILLYGIRRVVIGENSTFLGAEGLLRQRGVELVNLGSDECRQLMRDFIAAEPALWHEDIGEVQPE